MAEPLNDIASDACLDACFPHTCGGMYDLSCEACYELRIQQESRAEDLPGESRYAGWDYYEPEEWDVIGRL